METTRIVTVNVKGHYHPVPDADEGKYKAEFVKGWEFQHPPYTAANAIEVGRLMNQAQLYNSQGIGDPFAIDIARGQYIAQTILKGWNREMDNGEPLPVNADNIGTLPPDVLREFGRRIQRGSEIDKETLESLKN